MPRPVEIEVNGQLTTLPMTGNHGEITVPAGTHVLIDPHDRALRRLDYIETWKAREAADTGG